MTYVCCVYMCTPSLHGQARAKGNPLQNSLRIVYRMYLWACPGRLKFWEKASLVLGITEAIKATYDLGLSNSRAALVVRSSERTRNLYTLSNRLDFT